MKDKIAYLVGGDYDLTKMVIREETVSNDGIIRMMETYKNGNYALNPKSQMYDQIEAPKVLQYAKAHTSLRSGDDVYEFIGFDDRHA